MISLNELEPLKKIPIGVEGFENVAMGGMIEGRTTLVVGTSGSGKTLFALEVLYRGITQFDRPGVFITFEEHPRDIVRNVKKLGWDLAKLVEEGKLAFIDASPEPIPTEKTGPFDLSGLFTQIKYITNKINAKILVMDSIGSLFFQFRDPPLIRREIFRIMDMLKDLGVTSIITAERLEEYGPISRYGIEEFVSDNVIILRNVLEEEKCRRTIQILKVRGASHQKGEYPFSITDKGISILSLSSIELEQCSSSARIGSGNSELDRMAGGGFFKDSIILVSGPTGCGKSLMCMTFIEGACRTGEKVLLLSYEESQRQMMRNAKSWGLDFSRWNEKDLLKVICIYPEVMGLEEHLLAIKRVIKEFEPDRLVIDSISAMERVGSLRNFREFILGLTSYVKHKGICSVFTCATPKLSGGESITEEHISTITDAIILLRYVEIGGFLRRGISIIKMRGSQHDKEIREFTIDNEGLHILAPFKNVQNLLLGIPFSAGPSETEQLGEMFES